MGKIVTELAVLWGKEKRFETKAAAWQQLGLAGFMPGDEAKVAEQLKQIIASMPQVQEPQL